MSHAFYRHTVNLWMGLAESLGRLRQWHPRIGAAWAGDAGLNCGKVKVDNSTKGRRACLVAPKTLSLAVGLDQRELLIVATSQAKEVKC
jgi:hypothetical protein